MREGQNGRGWNQCSLGNHMGWLLSGERDVDRVLESLDVTMVAFGPQKLDLERLYGEGWGSTWGQGESTVLE